MSEKTSDRHTFAVCAYKESPFLDSCLESLSNQTVKSRVIVCTSTPSDYIKNLATKYGYEYFVRDGRSDIKDDWNFAYNCAGTEYVTITHQDDIYLPEYCEQMLRLTDESEKAGMPVTIYFTDYKACKNGIPLRDRNSSIRRILRWRLRVPKWSCNSYIKRRTFSLGNVVCCPTVTYHKKLLGDSVFTSDYKFNIDWDTFRLLSYKDGRFLCNETPLLYYRIHPGATSAEFIRSNERFDEDLVMFCKFWPKSVARFIMCFYPAAYKTYEKL